MPQSIYDNGGMVGVTLDFGDTDKYVSGLNPSSPIAVVTSTGVTTQSWTTSGYQTFSLPNSGLYQQGDMVIIAVTSDPGDRFAPGATVDPIVTGYTNGDKIEGVATLMSAYWLYKFMGASPDTTFEMYTGTGNYAASYAVVVLRGVDQSNPIKASAVYSASSFGSSGDPTIPDISSFGYYSDEDMAIGFGFLDDDNVASSVSAPSGWSLATAVDTSKAGATTMIAYTAGDSALTTQVGGTFSSSGSDLWWSAAVILRGGGAQPIYGNQKNSGIWSLTSVLETLDVPPAISFIGAYSDERSVSSYTISTDPFGTGLIAVSINSESGVTLAGEIPSSVSIGGVPATIAVAAASEGASTARRASSSIWYARLSGTGNFVEISYSGSLPSRVAIGVYEVPAENDTPIFTGTSVDETRPTSRSVTTSSLPAESNVIAAHTSGDVYTHTWSSPLTKSYDLGIGGPLSGTTGAYASNASGEVVVEVTEGTTPTSDTALAAAVWR